MRDDFLFLAGRIIWLSQLIEHNLRVIIFLTIRLDQKGRRLKKDEYEAEDVFAYMQKYSLGDLIDEAKNYGVLVNESIKYLKTVTPKRNKIAHTFFKDAELNGRLGNQREEQKMLNELNDMDSEFTGILDSLIKIIKGLERKGARH